MILAMHTKPIIRLVVNTNCINETNIGIDIQAWRSRGQKGIEVVALAVLKAVGHTGISMAKPDSDAVTVKLLAPAATLSVGARLPQYRTGAAACICAVVRGLGSAVAQPEGVVGGV